MEKFSFVMEFCDVSLGIASSKTLSFCVDFSLLEHSTDFDHLDPLFDLLELDFDFCESVFRRGFATSVESVFSSGFLASFELKQPMVLVFQS